MRGGFESSDASPQSQAIQLPDNGLTHPHSNGRHFSGIFGRGNAPQVDPQDYVLAELEALKKEFKRLRDELDTTKHELNEVSEARDASQTCVKALREFIAENNVGVEGPSPKLPVATQEEQLQPTAGWGFKLWKGDSSKVATPPLGNARAPTTTPEPLTKKIGGLFASRTSITPLTPTPPLPQLQTSHRPDLGSQRDSTYSFSDVSSVAEPISPDGDLNSNFLVRDTSSISDTGNSGNSLEGQKRPNLSTGTQTSVVVS